MCDTPGVSHTKTCTLGFILKQHLQLRTHTWTAIHWEAQEGFLEKRGCPVKLAISDSFCSSTCSSTKNWGWRPFFSLTAVPWVDANFTLSPYLMMMSFTSDWWLTIDWLRLLLHFISPCDVYSSFLYLHTKLHILLKRPPRALIKCPFGECLICVIVKRCTARMKNMYSL